MRNSLDEKTVALTRVEAAYPDRPPFHPGSDYPEYRWEGALSETPNTVYAGLRQTFRLLGLDTANYGSERWNPLGCLVNPGDTVVLKPNLIRESHLHRPAEWEQVVTHGALVRAIADYVFLALQGRGRVIIADGPQTDSDFEAICSRNGLEAVVRWYGDRGLDVDLLDLRRDRWYQKGDVIYRREPLPGDPAGYTEVDLAGSSEFKSYDLSGHFYGADYDVDETARFHEDGRHVYVLCRTAMDADVVINLPKLKTHKKVGVTLSLKNMVGINGYRNCLPHHTMGTPDEGGDEFPATGIAHKLQSRAIRGFKRLLVALGGGGGAWARVAKRIGALLFGETREVVRSGNWHGNDTAWRMVMDLNKVLFNFRGDGSRRPEPLRYMTIVDGIIAGDGDGPSAPDPVDSGVIVAGFNPVAVDTVCTALMGFDYRKLPVVARAWKIRELPFVDFGPEGVECVSDVEEWKGDLTRFEEEANLNFTPHFGWTGRIERAASGTGSAAVAS